MISIHSALCHFCQQHQMFCERFEPRSHFIRRLYHVSYNGIFKLKLVIDLIGELSCDVIGSTKRGKQITHKQVFSRLSTFDMGKLRKICWKECLSVSTIAKFESDLLETIQHVFIKIAKFYRH